LNEILKEIRDKSGSSNILLNNIPRISIFDLYFPYKTINYKFYLDKTEKLQERQVKVEKFHIKFMENVSLMFSCHIRGKYKGNFVSITVFIYEEKG
jgi:hypothetical protein